MKIPEKVKISPFEFILDHDPSELAQQKGYGMFDFLKMRIVLDLTQSGNFLRDSVIHEILHAVIRQTSIWEAGEEWADREEKLVSALAPRILGVLRDNPQLVKYLMASDE